MSRIYFNRAYLLEQIGLDDEDIMKELLEAYIETLEDSSNKLSLMVIEDQNEIRLEMHKLKGVCSSIGDMVLSDEARRLDLKGKDGDFITKEEVAKVIEMIEEALVNLKD